MKKFVFLLVFVLAGSALFGKFRAQSKIEEVLDMGIMMGSGYADISYGDAIVNLDSSISITDINIYDRANSANYMIEEVNFYSSNNWRIFTSFFRPIESALGKYILENPDKITFSVNNLNMSSDALMQDKSLCGSSTNMVKASLSDLGYERINFDFHMNIDATNKSRAKQTLYVNIDDIAEFDLDSEINLDANGPASIMISQWPEPKTVTLGLELDKDYASKAYKYCSEQNDVTENEYILSQFNADQLMQDEDFALPEETIQAFKKFILGGTRLELESTPRIKFSELDQLKHYKDEDKFKLLGLTIRIDDEVVPSDLIEKSVMGYVLAKSSKTNTNKDSDQEVASFETSLPDRISEIEVVAAPAETIKEKKTGFQILGFSELKDYVGYDVTVKRKNAKAINGKIISYNRGILKLERRLYGGSVDYQLRKSEISAVEAYL